MKGVSSINTRYLIMAREDVYFDPEQRKKFAEYLQSFAQNTRAKCVKARDHIESARSGIQADNAVKALESLRSSIEAIERMLPGVEDFALGEKKKAIKGGEAEEMKLTGKTR